MNIYIILISILMILFFIIFFYYLFMQKNELIQFKVIKEPIESNKRINLFKDKYKIKNCNDICNEEMCDEYQSQLIKYDLCKECKKENKCYDPFHGKCVRCTNYNTCEELFGCDKSPPISPIDNSCVRCWNIWQGDPNNNKKNSCN